MHPDSPDRPVSAALKRARPRAASLLAPAVALACMLSCGVAQAQAPRPKPAASAPAAQPQRAAPQAVQVDDRRWQELADQAEDAVAKGDFGGAERLGRDLVAEALKVFGDNHPNVAASRSILGTALFRQGRYPDAENEFRQALATYEARSGRDSVNVASALNNLALVLEKVGDFSGAELLLKRAHGILSDKLGANHADTATTMSNLGRVLDSQGKFGASAAVGASSRPGAPGARPGGAAPVPAGGDEAQRLAAQADEAAARGQYQAAESIQSRVVAIHERTAGAESPLTATSLSNLGNVLYVQGKFADAERVHRRVLAIREKVLGRDHPDTATSLNNLANVLLEQGKEEERAPSEQRARARRDLRYFNETEELYRRAMAIQEKALGPDHPSLANTLNNLGALLDQRGRSADAEGMQRRALAILEKSVGPLHPDTAASLTSLSVSLDRQGKIVEAEQTYARAVETARNGGNPRVLLLNASRLGFSLAKRGRYREALPYYREAVEALDFLYVRTRGLSEETRAAFLGQYSSIYLETIKVLLQLHRVAPQQGFDRQVLEIASRNQSRVFTELMRQSDVARFSGDPEFLKLRGNRDALQARIDAVRQTLVTIPSSQSNAEARRRELSAILDATTKSYGAVEDELWQKFPRFMELTNPRPVTVDDLQKKLLRPGEAVLAYVLLPNETVVFAVTPERLRMVVSNVKRDDIARRIHGIRRAIDKVTGGESVLFLRDIDPAVLNSLYRDLVGPVAADLAGKDKVILIGDGPLHTIPFEMLVTRWGTPEQQAFRGARQAANGAQATPFLSEYATLEYLGKSMRFAYLPSLSALTSQRLYPKAEVRRSRELVAFADPVFEGKALSPATRNFLDALGSSVPRLRDGTPDIPRLKETADEAREIAGIIGGTNALFIGEQAQEKRAKAGELKDARYVLFATHGFLGGDYLGAGDAAEGAAPAPLTAAQRAQKALAQPALALTIVGDLGGEDGMLTMKEVIEDLELNADMVALSACNTAGETAQANNGEGFAGLTRAFMYAGAKSLLVSHWSVDSLSTQALMTATFRNLKAGAGTLASRSDAQRSLVGGGYSTGQYHFSRANPFFWAPFVFVGD